jgi:hypothetical protein
VAEGGDVPKALEVSVACHAADGTEARRAHHRAHDCFALMPREERRTRLRSDAVIPAHP